MTDCSTITGVRAWEALDSRGNPTVAAEISLGGGKTGMALAPSGASAGRYEAHELRDGGARYGGMGTRRAAGNAAGPLAAAVRGLDATDQAAVDTALRAADGTEGLKRMGANAVLAISVATARAAAAAAGLPLHEFVARDGHPPRLPLPMVNILSGGAHAGWSIDVQDFLVVPNGAKSFSDAIRMAWEVRRSAAQGVRKAGHNAALVADEGGLGPILKSSRAALDILAEAISQAGYEPGADVSIAIDVAASQLFDSKSDQYVLATEERRLTAAELIQELVSWRSQYPIVSIEDPLDEDDWAAWPKALSALSDIQILGDDLFVTHVARVERGIREKAANAVLVKPNQIGTLTDAMKVVLTAREAGMATVLSARSGETEENWLADLAVGWSTGQIKVGSTTRSERTAKWNRLLDIEARSSETIPFAGLQGLAPLSNTGREPEIADKVRNE